MTAKMLKTLCVAVLCAVVASCGAKKEPAPAVIGITSSPDKAKVLYKGKEAGVTPFEVKTKAGSYIFELEKLNCKPKFVKVAVADGERRNVEVVLEEIISSVMIDSTPQEAIVEIDGREIGQTPIILHEQKIGVHKAILKKPGMVPVEVSWTVEDGRPQMVKANLSSNMGVMKVNVSPAHAQIAIDGKPRGKSPFSENIEQGEHTVTVEAPGYQKYEQKVVVERTREASLNIALNVLPGTVNVSSEPAGATISVDGRLVGRAPVSIPGLQPGKYQITAEKQGYDNGAREVDLAAGATADVTITLDTNMGGIDIAANPPGLTIYLDGKRIGKTERGESEKQSKIFEIRGLTFGKHVVRVSHARATPQDQVIEVDVKKGQIARPKPVNMWVADCIIKFKNSKKEVKGRLREEAQTKVFFEPEPGVAISYDKEEILSIERLKMDEE